MRRAWCAVLALAGTIPAVRAQPITIERFDDAGVPLVIKVLHEHLEFGAECDAAPTLVVAYQGEDAHVLFVLAEAPCAVLTAPADGMRRLLLHLLGQPV